jgi:Leucine-rich repeat (LRR) protein
MKITLTESQYRLLLTEDRLDYLKGQILVNPDEAKKWEQTKDKPKRPGPDGEEPKVGKKDLEPILDHNDNPIAFLRGPKKTLKLTEETFDAMAEADPSRNKQYVQWMIDVFRNLIGEGDMEHAVRFITEDLDQATEALTIFDCVKDRKKFKTIAPSRQGAPQNVKDIRQYKSVSQLYIVVSAFSCDDDDEDEGEGGEGQLSKKGLKLFKDIAEYAKLGHAGLFKLSDRVLIYQPKTMVASCEPLGNLATWCTRATPSGGIDPESGGAKYRGEKGSEYFHSYRGSTGQQGRLRPSGELSEYYVIMPIDLFQLPNPASHEWYPLQFHFESGQLMHKGNSQIREEGVARLLSEYPEVGEFLRGELGELAGQEIAGGEGLMDSKYIKYLNQFGGKVEDHVPRESYEEGVRSIERLAKENTGPINQNKYLKWLMSNTDDANILDFIGEDLSNLNFDGINLRQVPDLSRFTNATTLSFIGCNLDTMPVANHLPPNTTNITFQNNQIRNIHFEGWGERLQDLLVVNFFNNPLSEINIDNFKSVIRNCEGLLRIAFDGSLQQMGNYDQYVATLQELDEEGVTDGLLIDPYDR